MISALLSFYLTLNLVIALGAVVLLSVHLVNRRWPVLRSHEELKLHYRVLLAIPILTLVSRFFRSAFVFQPYVKVWSAPSIQAFSQQYSDAATAGVIHLPGMVSASSLRFGWLSSAILIAAAVGLAIGALLLLKDFALLRGILRRSYPLRSLGKIRFYVNDRIRVPFSFSLPGRSAVVVPSRMIEDSGELRIALLHELQHHRQGDTLWIYGLWLLKLLCGWNPALLLWSRLLSEVQEFACDEALVDQKKVSSLAYARCLVRVAESAVGRGRGLACATGLTFVTDRHSLTRRVKKMMNQRHVGNASKNNRSIARLTACAAVLILSGVAFASQGWVQDRRVTLKEAQAMATHAEGSSGIPVVVNDLVLKELNRYLGTPEGRDFMKSSLARMENYRELVDQKLKEYGVPEELMAIPIIESGYQNLVQDQVPAKHGAGLWMFIGSTAQKFGLTVDGHRDDRLNIPVETDAAMRLLAVNYLRFKKNWELSVLAYNMGEAKVYEGIQELGYDAWKLVRAGYSGDKDYYPRLMAAILIMRNPQTLE